MEREPRDRRVKFVYEGRRVRVKVTGPKKVRKSRNGCMHVMTNPLACSLKISSPLTHTAEK